MTKEQNKKAPNLRFKGFTNDWEQRKLYEVADYRNGKAHEQHIYIHGNYIVVNSKFVSTSGKAKKYSDKLIEPLMKNEIAFVLSDVPNGKALARTFLVKRSQKYTLNQRVAGITPHPNMNSYFLFILMNRNPYFLKFDDGVGQTNLSKKDVEQFNENYPTKREQQKIGEIFVKLDSLLTLQQRKLNLLEQLKKGLLQKIFTKENTFYPTLRFQNFNLDWKQYKLNDLVKIDTGKLDANAMVSNGKYDFYTSGIKKYKINNYAFKGPAITIAGNGATVGYMHYADNKFNAYQRTYVLTDLKADRRFLFNSIQLILPHKIYQESRTGNIPYIVLSMLTDLLIMVPSNKEQTFIGNLAGTISDIYNKQLKKLNLTNQLKKSLLQQMFI